MDINLREAGCKSQGLHQVLKHKNTGALSQIERIEYLLDQGSEENKTPSSYNIEREGQIINDSIS